MYFFSSMPVYVQNVGRLMGQSSVGFDNDSGNNALLVSWFRVLVVPNLMVFWR